jgi:hypothetical protein
MFIKIGPSRSRKNGRNAVIKKQFRVTNVTGAQMGIADDNHAPF